MNKTVLFPVILAIMFACCSKNWKEKPDPNSTVFDTQRSEILIPSSTDLIKIDLTDGEGSATIQKNENQTVYIEFSSKGSKKLSAHLSSPDSLANIRFSQIFMPDGKMDGPWGRDMEYVLPVDGTYKISVHENMMAGDPWAGVFKVEMKLEK